MDGNVPTNPEFEIAAMKSDSTSWQDADLRLSNTVDTLHQLVEKLEQRLVLVMTTDDVSESNLPDAATDRNAPVVKTLHHYADRVFNVNERLSAILGRLDI